MSRCKIRLFYLSLLFNLVCVLILFRIIQHNDKPSPQNNDSCNVTVCLSTTLEPSPKTTDVFQLTKDKFIIYTDYVVANHQFGPNETITIATQCTINYLQYLILVAERWQGPISVAIYAPAEDFFYSVIIIQRLRLCFDIIKDLVTFHIFYDQEFPPVNLTVIRESFINNWAKNTCTNLTAITPSSIETFLQNHPEFPYPINTGRNIAKQASKTHFILVLDIELIPSANIIPLFLNMIKQSKQPNYKPKVYVLPLFEIAKGLFYPEGKNELLKHYRKGEIVYFHKYTCPHCQRFPRIGDWLHPTYNEKKFKIFNVVKRHPPFHRWEPVFIGTNAEPEYDERLSWDGKLDKMAQMYELCLLDYDFCILDNAFLIHIEGIKKLEPSDDYQRRSPFREKNFQMYLQIVSEVDKKYMDSPNFKFCKKL